TALAAAAGGAVAGAQPGSLVLAGGAVARAVLTRLEAPELALTGRAIADGVPESVVASGPARGTRVVTKAGGFGDERTILNCLDAL
ncbi:four-carbon acid sugar kinase family protein, partial [Halobacteriales archaeon QH_6_68_27]